MADLVWMRERKNGASISYQVRWRERIDGVSRSKSKTFTDYGQARAFMTTVQRRLQVVRSADGIMGDVLKPAGDLRLLLERFANEIDVEAGERRSSTVELRYRIQRMIAHFQWKTTRDLTRKAMLAVSEFYLERPSMRHATVSSLRRFAKWYAKDNWADPDVLDFAVKRPSSPERVYWTETQVRTILAALIRPLEPRPTLSTRSSDEFARRISETIKHKARLAIAPLFRLLILWALRPIEASGLCVRNWNSERGLLTIPASLAKNRCGREIYVDGTTAQMLNGLCDGREHGDLIFLSSKGKQWKTNPLSHQFHQILRANNIPGSLYCARHYACTRLLRQAGAKHIRTVMAITGHKTLSQFQKYLHVCDEDLRSVASSAHAQFIDDIPVKPAQTSAPVTPPSPPPLRIVSDDDVDDDNAAGAVVVG